MTGQPSPDIQQLLATLVRATAELAQSNKQHNQKLDTIGAKVDQKLDPIGVKVDTFGAKMDAITDQIGKLSESMTAFRLDLDEIKETTQQQAETAKTQAETAKIQAESVKAQAENVSQLIALSGKK